MELPNFTREQTGNVILDRIQETLRALIAYVRALDLASSVTLMLAAAFTTTLATPQPTTLTFRVKAGELWDVEFTGRGACSSVNGMGYALGAPAGSEVSGALYTSSTNTSAANWLLYQFTAVNTAIGTCHAGASNAARPDSFTARVKCGQDGFITVLVYAVTAGTTATLFERSSLRASKATKV